MRLFLAINPPPQIKKDLAEQLAPFKREYPYFQWVPEENYHITISFFGDISLDERLMKAFEEATYDIPEFLMYSGKADLLMQPQKIILHLNFRRDANLEKLVKRITDKKFLPHLTFARYRLPSKQQYLLIKKKIQSIKLNVEFKVTKLYLFDSQMNNRKPLYKKMASFPLEKGVI